MQRINKKNNKRGFLLGPMKIDTKLKKKILIGKLWVYVSFLQKMFYREHRFIYLKIKVPIHIANSKFMKFIN